MGYTPKHKDVGLNITGKPIAVDLPSTKTVVGDTTTGMVSSSVYGNEIISNLPTNEIVAADAVESIANPALLSGLVQADVTDLSFQVEHFVHSSRDEEYGNRFFRLIADTLDILAIKTNRPISEISTTSDIAAKIFNKVLQDLSHPTEVIKFASTKVLADTCSSLDIRKILVVRAVNDACSSSDTKTFGVGKGMIEPLHTSELMQFIVNTHLADESITSDVRAIAISPALNETSYVVEQHMVAYTKLLGDQHVDVAYAQEGFADDSLAILTSNVLVDPAGYDDNHIAAYIQNYFDEDYVNNIVFNYVEGTAYSYFPQSYFETAWSYVPIGYVQGT